MANVKISNLTTTWTSNLTDYEGIKLDALNINSGTNTNLLNLLVDSTTKFKVTKNGLVIASTFSGSFAGNISGTSSWANNSINSQNAISASYATTASYVFNANHYNIKTVTGSYNILTTDYTVLCDATSGSFNIVLPQNSTGYTFNVKKIDSTGNMINVYSSDGSKIDFEYTQSITNRGTNMHLQSDGAKYWLL